MSVWRFSLRRNPTVSKAISGTTPTLPVTSSAKKRSRKQSVAKVPPTVSVSSVAPAPVGQAPAETTNVAIESVSQLIAAQLKAQLGDLCKATDR